jgi:methylaspartate ammonia-lyase
MDVDPEGEFPFLVRDILDRFEGRLVRRVVDENVDAAKLCDRLVDCRALWPDVRLGLTARNLQFGAAFVPRTIRERLFAE